MRKLLWITVFQLGVVLLGAAPAMADETVLLRAGWLHTGDGAAIEGGCVLVRNGKIAAVGRDLALPEGARLIEAEEGAITAGLIDAASRAGVGPGAGEQSSEFVPRLLVADEVDLTSPDFQSLMRCGVTTVYVSTDSSSVVGGRGAVVRTGSSRGKATLVSSQGALGATMSADAYMRGAFNQSPFGAPTATARRPTTRMGLVWAWRKGFYDAMALRDGVTPPSGNPVVRSDEDLRVLIDVMAGKIPLRVMARTRDDILRVVRLSEELGFTFVLEEALEVYRCLDVIQSKEIPVIFGPLLDETMGTRLPQESDRLCLRTPSMLKDKGVLFALTARELGGESALPFQACFAMRYGLSFEAALAAVTSAPARILGIDKRVGRVEQGMDADLVVWSGPPFRPTTRAIAVLVEGVIVHSEAEGDGS